MLPFVGETAKWVRSVSGTITVAVKTVLISNSMVTDEIYITTPSDCLHVINPQSNNANLRAVLLSDQTVCQAGFVLSSCPFADSLRGSLSFPQRICPLSVALFSG